MSHNAVLPDGSSLCNVYSIIILFYRGLDGEALGMAVTGNGTKVVLRSLKICACSLFNFGLTFSKIMCRVADVSCFMGDYVNCVISFMKTNNGV